LFGCHREFRLASLQVEYGICEVPLRKDVVARALFYNGFPVGDSCEEGFPIDTLVFLMLHNKPPTVLCLVVTAPLSYPETGAARLFETAASGGIRSLSSLTLCPDR
jgi:hypothetical protein